MGIISFILVAVGIFFIAKIKVTNKGISLFEKLMTTVLSAFIFSVMATTAVGMPIIIAFIFSFPLFLVIGGFISFFTDVYLNTYFENAFNKYILGLLIYFSGGLIIISLLYFTLFRPGGDVHHFLFQIFMISGIPTLLFYHISLLFKTILKKEVTLIKDQ